LFDSALKTATKGIYSAISEDYPTTLSIGPSYFESYQTWPGVKFIHGFNLGKNGTEAAKSVRDSAAYACKALSHDNFLYWEMGNEPDLLKTYGVRPNSWSEADLVKEWSDKVESVKESVKSACGDKWASEENFKWIAPSFAGTNNSLDTVKTWNAGLGKSAAVARWSAHKYDPFPGFTYCTRRLQTTATSVELTSPA
jgi:hypothetical protein